MKNFIFKINRALAAKKQKLITIFIALTTSGGAMFAESVNIGDLYYNLDENSHSAEVTSMPSGKYSGNISIPESVDYNSVTYNVTNIGLSAFQECSGLTSVTIPNGVTSIGDYAFYKCKVLQSVTIPNSITSIGEQAFGNCTGLTSVVIPNSVTSIGERAFFVCKSLTSIEIPNSITSIGEGAFEYCNKLTAVHISDIAAWCKISFDGFYANPLSYAHKLYLNGTLVTDLVIPNSVTGIGGWAFYDCSSLTSITIPNSVTSIGDSAFYNCSKLTSVTIPNSVTSIGEGAFYHCSRLTSITIPNSVTSIGDGAFYNCSSLTSITIPNSVTSIGHGAFMLCSSLTSITIPSSVTSIGEGAFLSCTSLTSITIPNSVTSIGNGAFSDCGSLPVIDNIRYADTYLVEAVDNTLSTYTIKEGTRWIGDMAFVNCRSLTSVTIPNSVTSIGDYAFDGCRSLTSVTISNSVTSIGEQAFNDCWSLTSVTIPNSVTSIGNYAFWCCHLTSITCEAVNPPTLGDKVFDDKSIPLYVPSSAVRQYKLAIGWKDFTNIQPISSQTGDVTTPTVTVTTTSADIAWPQISGAASYELVIKDKSGNVVCTLVFDAEGHLTSLNFGAPDRDNIRKQPQAGTFSFTVTGLKENTEYTYTLTAKDSQGKAIDTKTGTFKTIGDAIYTVTFKDWDGSVLKTEQVEQGHHATAPKNPTREGYTFTGWDKDFSNVQSDLTVTAQYKKNETQGDAITVRLDPQSCSDWSTVYLYYWRYNYNGDLWEEHKWPGLRISSDADGWYSYTFDSGITTVNIIWTNGTDQTVDITDVTESTCYSLNSTSGMGITVDAVGCSGVATAIDEVHSNNANCTKLFRNGHLFILCGDQTYTLQGQEVK